MTTTTTNDWTTPAGLAARLNISKGRVLQMARTGRLPVQRLGYRTLRFHIPTVDAALIHGLKA